VEYHNQTFECLHDYLFNECEEVNGNGNSNDNSSYGGVLCGLDDNNNNNNKNCNINIHTTNTHPGTNTNTESNTNTKQVSYTAEVSQWDVSFLRLLQLSDTPSNCIHPKETHFDITSRYIRTSSGITSSSIGGSTTASSSSI